ncbi:unnamed protein product [Aphanomyces euteiches]|uniref:Uncharacterized protein n=1 Tax=Aphanomyces euteiches TaxID=100861 RepID=A0A6G0XA41_9STRA|nr:hypothetical protein Ae201684_006785 [Aphanomyces euteiches]KAH9087065.1 hypothetical protein Ae201684P_000478 [Aphanomyces euteiches]KAH9135486.1 hypothetical protein AeRB84_019139 [Aphanomyces euteiches]
MDQLLIDALDMMPEEDVLTSTIDGIAVEDFEEFDAALNSTTSDSNLTSGGASSAPDSTADDSTVSSPLETPSSGDEVKRPVKKHNQSRKRQREEIEYLRSKVQELEQRLNVLQQIRDVEGANETPWQKNANHVRLAKQAALNENEKLKHALEEQIQFGKALQTLMANRPQLTVLPTLESEQWRLHKLVKDPVLRRQAMEEIFHQQYKLTDIAMIESGLQECVDALEAYSPRLAKSTADLVLHTAYCVTLDYAYNLVSDFAWMLCQNSFGSKRKNMSYKVLEKHNHNSVYMRLEKHWNDLANQANVLFKRFTEPTRDVIAIRTILEDELHPFTEGTLVMNKSAWIVCEMVEEHKKCRMKFFQKCTLPMVQSTVGTDLMDGHPVMSRFYRVGNVTDSALLSLKTIIADFANSMNILLTNYDGNVDDTFKRMAWMLE